MESPERFELSMNSLERCRPSSRASETLKICAAASRMGFVVPSGIYQNVPSEGSPLNSFVQLARKKTWWAARDSNPNAFRPRGLSSGCLPIPSAAHRIPGGIYQPRAATRLGRHIDAERSRPNQSTSDTSRELPGSAFSLLQHLGGPNEI